MALPWSGMKPLTAPNVPGNTEFERFDNAVSKLLSVPKGAFLKEEAKLKGGGKRSEEASLTLALCSDG